MENNDSPYLYEKPIRTRKQSRGTRVAGLTALGLVGAVGIFGGTAIASTLASNNLTTNEPAVLNLSAGSASTQGDNQSVIAFPITETEPKTNSIQVQLPEPSRASFTNTSSATPYSDSYPGGSSGLSSSGKVSSHYEGEDEHEEQEDHDRYEHGHYEQD